MKTDYEYYKKFGYEYFGPLLQKYVYWLIENLKKEKIEKVFFLSRDGYIIKKVFDIVNNTSIKSYYFYASRRAILVPILWKLKESSEIFNIIAFNKKIKVKSFIKKVGLEDYNLSELYKKYSYSENDYIEIDSLGNFTNLLEELFPLIKENSKNEFEALKMYAQNNNFYGKVAIVDIGWFGTMQNSIENLFDEIKVYGYYLGLVPKVSNSKINATAYIFDRNENIENYNKMHYFINIFEFLFLAQHGSVKKYTNDRKSVEFYEYEYSNYVEKDIAYNIQDGAIKYIKENYQKKLDDDEIINNFINFFIHPNYKASKMFGMIRFNDDEFKFIDRKSVV